MCVRVAVLAADRFKKRLVEVKRMNVGKVVMEIEGEGDTRPLTELRVLRFGGEVVGRVANFQLEQVDPGLSE